MLTCKVIREVAAGNVYKTIFPHAIKYFGVTNNPMALSKSIGKERQAGTYMITIRTLDRREYHLTKEIFNYEAVNILAEMVEAKLGFRILKERHLNIINKLNEEDKKFFSDTSTKNVMIHSKKLNNTLMEIEEILKK